MVSAGVFSVIILTVISLLIFAGFIVLQIFLSKRDNWIVGLILPVVTILMSLSVVSGVLYLNTAQSVVVSNESVITEEYEVNDVEEFVVENNTASSDVFIGYAVVFVMFNIPTGVYLVIYFVCRSKKRRLKENSQQKQLEKMSIQDLG